MENTSLLFMTDTKILEAIAFYRTYLQNLGIEAAAYSHTTRVEDRRQALAHLLQMIPQMEQFASTGQHDKVIRWLGFIQGVLWMGGYQTIHELKEVNRP